LADFGVRLRRYSSLSSIERYYIEDRFLGQGGRTEPITMKGPDLLGQTGAERVRQAQNTM
jgi:hypothetical protein